MKSTPDFAAMKKEDRIAKWTQNSPREAVENSDIQDFLSGEIIRHLQKSYRGYEIPLKALRPWLVPGDFGRLTLGQAGILPLWITDHHGVVIRMPIREPHRLPDRGGSL